MGFRPGGTFSFPNPGLGAIGSAVISHDDSGECGERGGQRFGALAF